MTKMQNRLAAAKLLAKAVANGEVHNAIPEDDKKALAMGYAYEAMLGKYLHKPALRYFTQFDSRGLEPRTKASLLRAARLADKCGVDYPVFVRSQFYWFDLWFHKPPKIYELSGARGKFPAERRLIEYLQLDKLGKINKEISSVVVPQQKDFISEQALDKINKSRLNQLCSTYQLTEEQVFAQFASAGLFDVEWLRRQPGYQRQEEGP